MVRRRSIKNRRKIRSSSRTRSKTRSNSRRLNKRRSNRKSRNTSRRTRKTTRYTKKNRNIRSRVKFGGGELIELPPCSYGFENINNSAVTKRLSNLESLKLQVQSDQATTVKQAEASGISMPH